MSALDALSESSSPIAERMQDLQRQAAQQYKPVVDDIRRSGCRDVKRIDHALGGLLDFCGYEQSPRCSNGGCWGHDGRSHQTDAGAQCQGEVGQFAPVIDRNRCEAKVGCVQVYPFDVCSRFASSSCRTMASSLWSAG